MGICLSCLKPTQPVQDDDVESLLSNDKAKIIEDELVSELRNKQLNAILNSTNDHLIDIASFKLLSNYGSMHSSSGLHQTQNEPNESGIANEDDENEMENVNVFKVTQVPDISITSEMQAQLADWNARYGQPMIQKYLEIVKPNDNGEKYIVEFV